MFSLDAGGTYAAILGVGVGAFDGNGHDVDVFDPTAGGDAGEITRHCDLRAVKCAHAQRLYRAGYRTHLGGGIHAVDGQVVICTRYREHAAQFDILRDSRGVGGGRNCDVDGLGIGVRAFGNLGHGGLLEFRHPPVSILGRLYLDLVADGHFGHGLVRLGVKEDIHVGRAVGNHHAHGRFGHNRRLFYYHGGVVGHRYRLGNCDCDSLGRLALREGFDAGVHHLVLALARIEFVGAHQLHCAVVFELICPQVVLPVFEAVDQDGAGVVGQVELHPFLAAAVDARLEVRNLAGKPVIYCRTCRGDKVRHSGIVDHRLFLAGGESLDNGIHNLVLRFGSIKFVLALEGHGAAVLDDAGPCRLAALGHRVDIDGARFVGEVKTAVIGLEPADLAGHAEICLLVGSIYKVLHGNRLDAVGVAVGTLLDYGDHGRGHASVELDGRGTVGTGILGDGHLDIYRLVGGAPPGRFGHNPVGSRTHQTHAPLTVGLDLDRERRFILFQIDGSLPDHIDVGILYLLLASGQGRNSQRSHHYQQ